VTGQIYVENAAPEQKRASAQGLITLATYGVGMYIGSRVQGLIQQKNEFVDATGQITNHDWYHIWIFPAILAAIVMVIFAIFFNEKANAQKEPA